MEIKTATSHRIRCLVAVFTRLLSINFWNISYVIVYYYMKSCDNIDTLYCRLQVFLVHALLVVPSDNLCALKSYVRWHQNIVFIHQYSHYRNFAANLMFQLLNLIFTTDWSNYRKSCTGSVSPLISSPFCRKIATPARHRLNRCSRRRILCYNKTTSWGKR